jgi:hypothetical protein
MRAVLVAAITDRLTTGPSSACELMQALRVSQTTISRALRQLEREQRILRMGATRGARYALRRPIAAIGSQWPVYRVDESGTPHEIGALSSLQRDSYHVDSGPARIAGTFDGLPYYLQDARPAGFLGRTVPASCPELGLPARVNDWTDEHFLVYLTERGSDSSGNLIVGAAALNRHLGALVCPVAVAAHDRGTRYPEFAAAALAGAPPGSSANGEHPKFTACVADGARRTQVLVKFSPPRSTPAGMRWADLLTAEYLAHRVLEAAGIAACSSQLLDHADQVFLECERFDRVCAHGRRGVVSLHAVDVARYGRLDNWTACAGRLAADSLISPDDAERIRLIDAFGALIANTDRHFGNVTLFDDYAGRFELAPVYDMLPMRFSPNEGEVPSRQFETVSARAEWLTVWPRACALAEEYWSRLKGDPRMSPDFQQIAAQGRERLRALPHRAH